MRSISDVSSVSRCGACCFFVSYIFGDNAGSRVTESGEVEPQTVAMTAPVRTEQPQKATVAMTSPVRTEVKSNFRNMRVSFVMPKKVR